MSLMRWDSVMRWCMHAGQGYAVNQMPRCWPCGHALQPGRSASEAALQFSAVKQKPTAVIHCWEAMDVDLLRVGRNTQIVRSAFSYCLNWHEEVVI